MRKIAILSILLAVFALILPIVFSVGNGITDDSESDTAEPSETSSQVTDNANTTGVDQETNVRVLIDGDVQILTMTDYLIGVVAAEMPASFEPEALKAQAVAARTYTLYKMLVNASQNHPDADVCTDSKCCKAYADLNTLKEKWGDQYETYLQKITDAVNETEGVYLAYEDEPILAVFHSSSAGQTEESESVWGYALPYLTSVASPEKADEVPNYISSVTISLSDFKETFKIAYPDASFGADPDDWITGITYTGSGRINSLVVGGVTVPGTALRSVFELRSTAIDTEINEESITFVTTGYGHGVGMSQFGANTLAEEGYDYIQILSWYYTGIAFENMSDLF